MGLDWVLSSCLQLGPTTLLHCDRSGCCALLPALLWLRRPLKPQHLKKRMDRVYNRPVLLLKTGPVPGRSGKTAVMVSPCVRVLVLAWPILGGE